METKICTKCGEEKALTEFYTTNRNNKPYILPSCKKCCNQYATQYAQTHRTVTRKAVSKWAKNNPESNRCKSKRWKSNNPEYRRKYELKSRYGLTLEAYKQLIKNQDGKCAICGEIAQDTLSSLFVDHDHITGKIRGLLCIRCNAGIGFMQDNSDICRKAANYLEQNK
jgi:hypothetical protein